MHLPATPPPPQHHDKRASSAVHLAALWSRVARTQAIPDDVDIDELHVAIRDRLCDPEWEVRLHALRALADLLPLSRNALAFPFDEAVDNLGHGSPTVRKAALDALKVFCLHCEDPESAVRAIVDRCDHNSRERAPAGIVASNIITGLILSIPSIMAILRRRSESLDAHPVVLSLGFKLFDAAHRDVALRSMIKLRRICGTNDFISAFERLNPQIQDKFRVLCEVYDDDNFDVQYGPRRDPSRDYAAGAQRYSAGSGRSTGSSTNLSRMELQPLFSKDVSSDESQEATSDVSGKVIIETEITFDSDTAITMTVLEENETESDRNYASDESCSSERHMLKGFSETESEDPDVVVSSQKRVRFGGETVKIRTPDSDNLIASEEENKGIRRAPIASFKTIDEVPAIESVPVPQPKRSRRSGIPLPIISKSENALRKLDGEPKRMPRMVKKKSKSLSELYDYFRMKNVIEPLKPSVNVPIKHANKPQYFTLNFTEVSKLTAKSKSQNGFALSVAESLYPEKAPSPVEAHREVEVLHNLARSPTRSPRARGPARAAIDQDEFAPSVLRSCPERSPDALALEPLASRSTLKAQYEWESLDAVPRHIVEQLHNTENWISAVRAADQLHRALLEREAVRALEPAGASLAEHMWALGDAVSAARAPAESAVCALVRGASPGAARRMLPSLVRRLVRAPPPAALPHALLARLTLSQLVDLIFDNDIIGVDGDEAESARLRGAWCAARAAGPAAVLASVRRRLAGHPTAEYFCEQLRQMLRRSTDAADGEPCGPPAPAPAPAEQRGSMLPVPVSRRRRRARSTPPPAPPPRAPAPRRLRPIADSAPPPGSAHPPRDYTAQPLFPILATGNSSTASSQDEKDKRESQSRKSSAAVPGDAIEEAFSEEESVDEKPSSTPRSPSIRVEDFSERTGHGEDRSQNESPQLHRGFTSTDAVGKVADSTSVSRISLRSDRTSAGSSPPTRAPTPQLSGPPSRASSSLPASRAPTRSPSPTSSLHPSSAKSTSKVVADETSVRDVRGALAACIAPPRQQEDWEGIVRGLREVERLAGDPSARAPAASWRATARATAAHVRSLRSRVARTACCTLGALFEAHGRVIDPETEEAAGALLDRTADVNRFLRGDAEEALARLACGVTAARAVTALTRRGAAHRAGPVRAAAASALAELVVRGGAARALDLPPEPRALLLRAAVDLLGDASPEARAHARRLCVALAEDSRFRPLLKESLPANKYKSVEKSVDRLRCR